jgi:hypothetical protein
VIDSVERKEKSTEVLIKWNGNSIGVDMNNSQVFAIPALGDFKIMDIKVVNEPEQYVSIMFSDPILENQNLSGLITINGAVTGGNTNGVLNENIKFSIDGNEVKGYASNRLSGIRNVNVEAGIKNILGYPLKEKMTMEVRFEELKPQVKLVGKGVILPYTEQGFVFPFQAVIMN